MKLYNLRKEMLSVFLANTINTLNISIIRTILYNTELFLLVF